MLLSTLAHSLFAWRTRDVPVGSGRKAARPLGQLVEDVVAEQDGAWETFVAELHPYLVSLCRKLRLRGGGDEDCHAEVALRVIERVRDDDFRALRRFLETRAKYAASDFGAWLTVVVRRTHIDYLRSLPEAQRRRVGTERHLEQLVLKSLEGSARQIAGHDPGPQIELRRIIGLILSGDFPAEQRQAIALWLKGYDNREIAEVLGLDSGRQAGRLLHAARQRLRRAHGGTR